MQCVTCQTNEGVHSYTVVAFIDGEPQSIPYPSCFSCFSKQGGFCSRCQKERALFAFPRQEQKDAHGIVLAIHCVCAECCMDQALTMAIEEGQYLVSCIEVGCTEEFIASLDHLASVHKFRNEESWRGRLFGICFNAAMYGKSPEQVVTEFIMNNRPYFHETPRPSVN